MTRRLGIPEAVPQLLTWQSGTEEASATPDLQEHTALAA